MSCIFVIWLVFCFTLTVWLVAVGRVFPVFVLFRRTSCFRPADRRRRLSGLPAIFGVRLIPLFMRSPPPVQLLPPCVTPSSSSPLRRQRRHRLPSLRRSVSRSGPSFSLPPSVFIPVLALCPSVAAPVALSPASRPHQAHYCTLPTHPRPGRSPDN